jgi:hypothetical protein
MCSNRGKIDESVIGKWETKTILAKNEKFSCFVTSTMLS